MAQSAQALAVDAHESHLRAARAQPAVELQRAGVGRVHAPLQRHPARTVSAATAVMRA